MGGTFIWLGMAGLGLVGTLLVQSRLEASLGALPDEDVERIGARVVGPSRLSLAVIVTAVGLFVALGRGPRALTIAVGLLVANAWTFAALRWWAARDVAHARSWNGWVFAQAVASTSMFVGVTGYLRGW